MIRTAAAMLLLALVASLLVPAGGTLAEPAVAAGTVHSAAAAPALADMPPVLTKRPRPATTATLPAPAPARLITTGRAPEPATPSPPPVDGHTSPGVLRV